MKWTTKYIGLHLNVNTDKSEYIAARTRLLNMWETEIEEYTKDDVEKDIKFIIEIADRQML